ncbi:uncharacterized protein LOC110378654 [Helicoverpa armigera]|uniref:Uncharacterized protein n=1 Tax=Helicoverpa armigera TaxID=29058 RepID=A0A2W1BK45_HELAM|nr:uncharacterized protein LOC110378654 [Helicoverpa armigera]XP_047034965.1 uncharacterized protein LOC124641002 [Helicoverpa zea]PZC75409.1 hypothetical protein B5X24_HaOG200781 [Helicoverpa armigera]
MTCSRALALLALVALTQQATTVCKNCIMLGKEEKAMFRAHSAACAEQSRVAPRQLDALLAGRLHDSPALRRHVYCVLLKCKLVGKDGKLHKAAVLGKIAARPDAKNATKVLESCADQAGDSPEDLAWNLFRCGYDKKALLFDYMPTNVAADVDNTS